MTVLRSGSLSHEPLPYLLHGCYRDRLTGVLTLDAAGGRKQIYVRQGYPVSVTATGAIDHLGRVLLESGFIDESTFKRTIAGAVEDGARFGQTLVGAGTITAEQLREALKIQVRRRLYRLFFVERGDFTVQQSDHHVGANDDDLRIQPRRAIYQGIRGAWSPQRVRLAVASLDGRLVRVSLEPGVLGRYGFSDTDALVAAALLQAPVTLRDVASATGQPIDAVNSVVCSLLYTEALEMSEVGASAEAPATERPSPEVAPPPAIATPVGKPIAADRSPPPSTDPPAVSETSVSAASLARAPESDPAASPVVATLAADPALEANAPVDLEASVDEGFVIEESSLADERAAPIDSALPDGSPMPSEFVPPSLEPVVTFEPSVMIDPSMLEQESHHRPEPQKPTPPAVVAAPPSPSPTAKQPRVEEPANSPPPTRSSSDPHRAMPVRAVPGAHDIPESAVPTTPPPAVRPPPPKSITGAHPTTPRPSASAHPSAGAAPRTTTGSHATVPANPASQKPATSPTTGTTGKYAALSESTRPLGASPAGNSGSFPSVSSPEMADLRRMVDSKLQAILSDDLFAALNLKPDADRDQIKAAYLAAAKVFHPDRFSAGRLAPLRDDVGKIFRKLNEAYATLYDDGRRAAYLKRKSEPKNLEDEAKVRAVLDAEMSFLQGEVLFKKRDYAGAVTSLLRSVELNPEDGEHLALLSWARLSGKQSTLYEIKPALLKAIALSPRCARAHYYLGVVLREEGDLDKAVIELRQAVEMDKRLTEAAAELRLINLRREKKDQQPKGLFDRFRKK